MMMKTAFSTMSITAAAALLLLLLLLPTTVSADQPSMSPSDMPSMSPSDMPSMTPSIQPMQGPIASPGFNLNPAEIDNDNPADGYSKTWFPRGGFYPIVGVAGVVIIGTIVLGCLAHHQKKKATTKLRQDAVESLRQHNLDEYFLANPSSVQASLDVNSTGSLEEISLEDDDVERGGTSLDGSMTSDISSIFRRVTPTEKVFPRSMFPALMAYLKEVEIKPFQKSRRSEQPAGPPLPVYGASDSCWDSHGSVSESNSNNDDNGDTDSASSVYLEDLSDSDDCSCSSSDDCSSSDTQDSVTAFSVYLEDVSGSDVVSDYDDSSSISSRSVWEEFRSMDNFSIIWSSPAYNGDTFDTCERAEI